MAALLAPLLALQGYTPLGGVGARAAQQSRAAPVVMPLGTPKVAYRPPGAMNADWIDIYNRMYRERILFLGQEVDEQIANQLVAIMLYLDSEDNNKLVRCAPHRGPPPTLPTRRRPAWLAAPAALSPTAVGPPPRRPQISMYINSPGGSVPAGFAIFDTMRHIKSDVSTINIGLAASMGSFLLCGGAKGKRLALPHSRTMIHQPAAGGIQGQASDIKIVAEQILTVREKCVKYYAELSGQPKEKVIRDLDRDNFLSAQEAFEYGLIDKARAARALPLPAAPLQPQCRHSSTQAAAAVVGCSAWAAAQTQRRSSSSRDPRPVSCPLPTPSLRGMPLPHHPSLQPLQPPSYSLQVVDC